jgi:hypothetical protein
MFHELLHFLDTGIEYGWSRDCALPVTKMLLRTDNAHVAPGLMNSSQTVLDDYDYLINRLYTTELLLPLGSDYVSVNHHYQNARAYADEWVNVSRNISLLRKLSQKIVSSEDFRIWMEWDIHEGIKRYIERNGALFNIEHAPTVSSILTLNDREVRELWSSSREYDLVKSLSWGSDDFRLHFGAYMVSGLIRGVINNEVARRQRVQVYHSPFRHGLFGRANHSHRSVMEPIFNVEFFLAIEILAGALKQSKLRKRVDVYAENVHKARQGIQAYRGQKLKRETGHDAHKIAIGICRDADVTLWNRRSETMFSALVSTASGVCGSVYFDPWTSLAVGAGVGIVAEQQQWSRNLARVWEQNIRKMSSIPGCRVLYTYNLPFLDQGHHFSDQGYNEDDELPNNEDDELRNNENDELLRI